MMDKTKSCKVHIFGDEYALVSAEPEEHVLHAARLVDSLMKEIAGKAPLSGEKRIAVLAALRMASTVLQRESEIAEQRLQEQSLVDLIDKTLIAVSSPSSS